MKPICVQMQCSRSLNLEIQALKMGVERVAEQFYMSTVSLLSVLIPAYFSVTVTKMLIEKVYDVNG